MCPALALGGVGYDIWKADVYEAASLTFRVSSRISSTVNGYAELIGITTSLWKLDKYLKKFLESVYTGAAESAKAGKERTVDTVDLEEIKETVATLREIAHKIERMYDLAKSKGLTNRSLVGPAINSVRTRGDEIADLVESIDAAFNPHVDAIIERTLEEYRRGEVHDLAELK